MIHPSALQEARLQLHYAIQPLAAATNLLPPEPESQQTGLIWVAADSSIRTQAIPSPDPITIAFDPNSFTITVTSAQGQFTCPLPQQSLFEVFVWLKKRLQELGVDTSALAPLSYPTFDFPFHPLALGEPFAPPDAESLGLLIRAFDCSHAAIAQIIPRFPHNSAIKLWPHHFDLATVLHYDNGKVIGLGFSPSDHSYGSPYWYVYPYPYPEELPELALGQWHRAGWTGAVWILADEGQIETGAIATFLSTAISTAQACLGVAP